MAVVIPFFKEHLICARHFTRSSAILFKFVPSFRVSVGEETGSERLNNLPKIVHLLSCCVRTKTLQHHGSCIFQYPYRLLGLSRMAVWESWQPSSSPVWGDHFTHGERGCVRICHHYVNNEVAILPRNHISELGRGYGTERLFQVKCISSFLQGQIRFSTCLWFNLIEMVIFELTNQVRFLFWWLPLPFRSRT